MTMFDPALSLSIVLRVALGVVAVVSVTLGAHQPVARAAAPTSAESEEEAAMRRGLGLREKGDDAAALDQFKHAYDLRKTGRARAQMALAEQALGHWLDAETHLTEALQQTREPWIARNTSLLTQALADIREHLGSLEISGGAPGAEVLVNGRPAGQLPFTTPLRVEAGSVAVEVRAAGYLPVVRTVLVPAKGLAREPIVFVAAGGSGAPPGPGEAKAPATLPPLRQGAEAAGDTGPMRDEATSHPKRIVGVALGVAGVAALGAGIAFHLTRQSRAAAFNDALCTVDSDGMVQGPTAGNCPSRSDSVQSARNLAIAGYVAAPLLLGAGAYLFFSDHGEATGSTRSSTTHATLFRRLACVPTLDRGVACAARF